MKSDFRYYSILQAWNANKNIDFKLTNSHEKTYSVRDTSLKATLYTRIRERLSASKNMLVILSTDTRKSGIVLSYEIEQAIDNYKIPLIIAYPAYSAIWDVDDDLSAMWPTALSKRINLNFCSLTLNKNINRLQALWLQCSLFFAICAFGYMLTKEALFR